MYKLLFVLICIASMPYCVGQETTPPQFPGGEKKMIQYIESLTTPLLRKDTYAHAIVLFYVGTDGNVLRPTVATSYSDSPDFPVDSLALTIVKQMPDWKPGSVNSVLQERAASVTIRFGESKKDEYGNSIFDSDVVLSPFASEEQPEEEKIEFVVVKDLPKTDFVPPVITTDEDVEINTFTPPAKNVETQMGIADISKLSTEQEVPVEIISEEEEKPFTTAEQMPEYPGGEVEFQNYVTKNLKYPVIAQESGIEGTVIVRFIVEKDGTLSDIRLLKGIHPVCDKEALRLMEYCPKWIPGKQNGNIVRTYATAKINFTL